MFSKNKKYHFPPGYSFMRSVLKSNEFVVDPIKFIVKSMRKFGGTYAASPGLKKKIILTQHPGFINHILKDNHTNYSKSPFSTERAVLFFGKGLLFSNGNYWLRQRRLIQPAFHREKLKGLYGIIINTINEELTNFPVGETVDVYPFVHQVSFTILIRSLFNIDIPPAIMKELSDLFSDVQDFIMKDVNQPLQRLFYPVTGTMKANIKKAKRLRAIFLEIIKQRLAGKKQFDDLLDMLLNSKYEDTGEPMNEEQIIDEVLILIFAGHETTANTLSWLLYLLASNKEALQKLTASFTGTTVYDCLDNNYLKATINEGMRLYPAAWMTDRVAIEGDQFGEYSFPKDTIIISFFFGLHRDEMLWEEATMFKPERFITEDKLQKPKNFFPFGAGPRMCIGNNFATAEMSFFLFAFLRAFEIRPTSHQPSMKALITLRPQKVILSIKKNYLNRT